MKWTQKAAVLFLVPISLLTVNAQTIASSEAKKHVGEIATVCGKVARERTATSTRGTPTFINLDAPYPNQDFTILIWGSDRAAVGVLPRVGSRICAFGTIQDYRGVPEIIVKSSNQLKLDGASYSAPANRTSTKDHGDFPIAGE